ncbi:Putative protein of unknown function [Podospora comata]|uniref:Calcineurin-like phosphoesterase domain-containing protein n=1 Tax=Podospora comata TaxID=48703 RepID=A0ABY6SC19_PODCO|nr:Putative protein of unknown function [Podospora comata]
MPRDAERTEAAGGGYTRFTRVRRASYCRVLLVVSTFCLLGPYSQLLRVTIPFCEQLGGFINHRHRPQLSPLLPPLKFKKDGSFQLSIFSDLHFGENAWEPWGPKQDLASLGVINSVLDREPETDFVVLNGDIITGENVYRDNGTQYIDKIAETLASRDITWGSTYGNHDSDCRLSPTAMFEREKRYKGSRTARMVRGREEGVGVTNYYLEVQGLDARVEMVLWFFDSRGGFVSQEEGGGNRRKGRENWVSKEVVRWFREMSGRLKRENGGRSLPGLGFVHIPTGAFWEAQKRGIDGKKQPGINGDQPVNRQGEGWCEDGMEGCEYGGQDGGFMEAVMEEGLLGLFVGHDHGDTWCSDYEKGGRRVYLCFGQHTGYGGYGSWIRGSRQVWVSIEGLRLREMDTWVRLESGKVVGRVRLNETFGRDEYEVVEDERTHLPVDEEN